MWFRTIFGCTIRFRPATWTLFVWMVTFFLADRCSRGDDARLEKLDLVLLSTNYIDSVGTSKIAKLEYDKLVKLKRSNSVPSEHVQIAQIRLETSNRKKEVLRGIIEIELAGAERDSKYLRETEKANGKPTLEIHRVERTLDVLRLILHSNVGKVPSATEQEGRTSAEKPGSNPQ